MVKHRGKERQDTYDICVFKMESCLCQRRFMGGKKRTTHEYTLQLKQIFMYIVTIPTSFSYRYRVLKRRTQLLRQKEQPG